jgi:hypothetical protein
LFGKRTKPRPTSTDAPPISTKTDVISAVIAPVARNRETPRLGKSSKKTRISPN